MFWVLLNLITIIMDYVPLQFVNVVLILKCYFLTNLQTKISWSVNTSGELSNSLEIRDTISSKYPTHLPFLIDFLLFAASGWHNFNNSPTIAEFPYQQMTAVLILVSWEYLILMYKITTPSIKLYFSPPTSSLCIVQVPHHVEI